VKKSKNIESKKTIATAVEQKTRGQNSNPEWYRERSFRLTASKFGKICKMRLNTYTGNTVIVIYTISGIKAIFTGFECEDCR
jgi:hypothetical protein